MRLLASLGMTKGRAPLARNDTWISLAPGGLDVVAARVGDRLAEVLVQMRRRHDPRLLPGELLAEHRDLLAELVRRGGLHRLLEEGERLLELRDHRVAAHLPALERHRGLVVIALDAGGRV